MRTQKRAASTRYQAKGWLRVGLFSALSVGLWAREAPAQPTCIFTQATSSTAGDSFEPSINAAGTRIAFVSTSDLTGGNADGNAEIFLFDSRTHALTQITSSVTGGSGAPSISADGMRIAFLSSSDLTGNNPDGNNEIFLFDGNTDTLLQVTISGTVDTGVSNGEPSLSADGTRMAFASDGDYTGFNFDRNPEVFLVDFSIPLGTQITDSTQGSLNTDPRISSDGNHIVVVSNGDFSGRNPDGSFEIFLVDVAFGAAGAFEQITDTSGPFVFVQGFPNSDASRIAIVSDSDLTGSNPEGTRQIFLFEGSTGSLTQVTPPDGVGAVPSIDAAGTRIAFTSPSDLTGENPDGNNEIFLFDTDAGTFTQVTDTEGGSSLSEINADGARLALESTSDLTGGNPDGNAEIFLAECNEVGPVPTVVIDGCDSGVPDAVLPDGRTITEQILECAAGAGNHGAFVSCVSHLTNDLKDAGIITGAQRGAIQRCAGQAQIP